MHFKNKLINHCEVDICQIAVHKIYGSKRNVIDFCGFKIAIYKVAINKNNGKKSSIGECTIRKSTGFKFGKVQV